MSYSDMRPFDAHLTADVTCNDREFLSSLVEIFASQYPQSLAILKESLAANDMEGFTRAAHTIKGSVSNFGGQPTFDLALALEMMGRSGDLSEAAAVIPELERELKRLEGALRDHARGV